MPAIEKTVPIEVTIFFLDSHQSIYTTYSRYHFHRAKAHARDRVGMQYMMKITLKNGCQACNLALGFVLGGLHATPFFDFDFNHSYFVV